MSGADNISVKGLIKTNKAAADIDDEKQFRPANGYVTLLRKLYARDHLTQVFIAGHVPEDTCDWHQVVCGKPAIVYPKSVRAWARYVGKPQAPVCEAPRAGRERPARRCSCCGR